ncbi:MAG: hypothetical protein M3371_11055 [Acidobacteriota bacterium]|nr:hypothetical protein [Acidobacteriota bacterium]
MKCYSSFLIRCWLIEDTQQGEKKVIDVEHIQSGGHTRVASLTEAEEWMFEACRIIYFASGGSMRGDQEQPQINADRHGLKQLIF